MIKELVIKFVKMDCTLVAQQMSIRSSECFNKKTEHTNMGNALYLYKDSVSLIASTDKNQNTLDAAFFDSNTERDEYLEKVVKWISKEQFNVTRKLEVGKPCMVSLSEEIETNEWVMARLLAILPKPIRRRYITQSKTNKEMFTSWTYARPVSVSFGQKIDGDVYTWEMEVEE